MSYDVKYIGMDVESIPTGTATFAGWVPWDSGG
jgi:hypothetical protein